jgi:hypothetical protein
MNASDSSRHGRENDGRMRITDQFRDKGSMVYDLKGCGLRISLRVSERTDAGLCWEIAALAKTEAPFPTLTAVATTRREALAGLARAWEETQGRPAIDWPSVGEALAAVRAI